MSVLPRTAAWGCRFDQKWHRAFSPLEISGIHRCPHTRSHSQPAVWPRGCSNLASRLPHGCVMVWEQTYNSHLQLVSNVPWTYPLKPGWFKKKRNTFSFGDGPKPYIWCFLGIINIHEYRLFGWPHCCVNMIMASVCLEKVGRAGKNPVVHLLK